MKAGSKALSITAAVILLAAALLNPGMVWGEEGPGSITAYTCGMHPSVRISPEEFAAGNRKCPICSMDLVPVASGEGSAVSPSVPSLRLDSGQIRRAGIETAAVRRRPLFKEIDTVGTVTYDESKVALVAAWSGGRIDRLFVDFTGVPVGKGEHLVWIYSPELITAQEEYLVARKRAGTDERDLSGAGRLRLRRLGLTDEQILKLEEEGDVADHITVYSPIGGTVIEKPAMEGKYVKKGDPLYRIADLSRLWVVLDIYEYELGWIRPYQEAEITVPAYPGESFSARIVFIEPFLDPRTRTVKVRLNLPNPDGRFKPEMFVNARIRVPLSEFGRLLEPELVGKYICTMHPEIIADVPGACPRCGMDLVKVSAELAGAYEFVCPMNCIPPRKQPGECPVCGMKLKKAYESKEDPLTVPVPAVIDTGRRRIVWVESGENTYRARPVEIGPEAVSEEGDDLRSFYPVVSGLREGEKVVVRGNFLIDSQSRLTGRTEAAYGGALEEDSPAPMSGHRH